VVSPSTDVVLNYDGSSALVEAIITARVPGVPATNILPAELVPMPYAPTPSPDPNPSPTSSPIPQPTSSTAPTKAPDPTPVPSPTANPPPGPTPTPSRTPPPTPTPAPPPAPTPAPTSSPASGVQPLPAAAFNASVGVNTHINYWGGIYDTGYASWEPVLAGSLIKHLRDTICSWGTQGSTCNGTTPSGSSPSWAARVNALSSAGAKFDFIANPWEGWTTGTTGCNGTCVSGYMAAVGVAAGAVEAYEGPDECDINESAACTNVGTMSSLTGVQVVQQWAPYYSQLADSGISIYGASVAFPAHFAEFGNLSAYMQYGNFHNYTYPDMPETSSNCCSVGTWFADSPSMNGIKPVVTTETGFTTSQSDDSAQYVSNLAQESYIPRIFMWQLKNGITKTYLYELLDEDGTGGYGLLNSSFQPKPSWTMLSNIMAYFADTGTSPQTPLTYSISGDTTGHLQSLLFQRSNGQYILVPWLATQLANTSTHADIPPASESLTLNLPASVQSVQLTTFNTNGTMTTTNLAGGSGTFTLPATSLIEAAQFSASSTPSLRKRPRIHHPRAAAGAQ
jgi:hypothetical protein